MPTIHDVARLAEVGVGSVSRYLNGAQLKPTTTLRIEAAIQSLGFIPNRAARGLARGRIPTIAVLVPFATSPSVLERVRGLLDHARPLGLPVSILDVQSPAHLDDHLDALCSDLRPEALVVVSLHVDDDHLARLVDVGVEPVFVDVDVPGHPSITIDDTAGGRLAARHLLDLGHRRLAFVGDEEGGDLAFVSSARRREGFLDEVAAEGAEHDVAVMLAPHGADHAARVTRELLTGPDGPTALFAASDTQALGALRAARELGRHVPEELSIIGFDDIEAASWSGLTTIRQPLHDMSRQALEMVSAARAGDRPEPLHRKGELALVERGTTSAL